MSATDDVREPAGAGDVLHLQPFAEPKPVAWWRRRELVLGAAATVAVAAAAGAVLLVTGPSGGADRLATADVVTTPSAIPSPTVEPAPSVSPVPVEIPPPPPPPAPEVTAATTPAAAPSPAAPPPPAAAPSPAAAPVTTQTASPTTAPAPPSTAPSPTPTTAGPGEVTVTLVNDTRLELIMHVGHGDGSRSEARLAPGTRQAVVLRPNPEHASVGGAQWTGDPACSNGNTFIFPSPGSYTVVAAHYDPSMSDPAPQCGGEREFSVESPDARG